MKDNKNEKNDRVNDSINKSSLSTNNNSKIKKYNYDIVKIISKTKGIVMLQLIKPKSKPRNGDPKPRNKSVRELLTEFMDSVNKKFDEINQKVEDVKQSLNKKIDDVKNSINNRLDNIVKLNNLKE